MENFPTTVRFFDVDHARPDEPRTALVLGEGAAEGTLDLMVLSRPREDLRRFGESRTVLGVPFHETLPVATVIHEARNSRFYPKGFDANLPAGGVIPRLCCLKLDPKEPASDVGQNEPPKEPAKAPKKEPAKV